MEVLAGTAEEGRGSRILASPILWRAGKGLGAERCLGTLGLPWGLWG